MRMHHLTSTIACILLLTGKYGISEFSNGIIFGEFTTIFNDLRIILKFLNLKQNKLYQFSEIAFAFSFLIIRFFIFPSYIIYLFSLHIVPLSFKIEMSIINAISLFWILEIIMTIGMKFSSHSTSSFIKQFRFLCQYLRSSRISQFMLCAIIFIPQVLLSFYMHMIGA